MVNKMSTVSLTIDGQEFTVPDFLSVRKAALKNKIYVPGLCSHPDLNPFKPFNWSEAVWQGELQIQNDRSTPPFNSPSAEQGGKTKEEDFPHCNLCLVSVNGGEPQRACTTKVADGMDVRTNGADLVAARREALKKILAHHPHACLTCAQKEGCDRVQCSMDVPVEERCCELLGRCEIGKVAEYIGIPNGTPAYRYQNRPTIIDEPLFIHDYELYISCLRCVRICRDVRGVDVLGAVASGGFVRVGTTNGPSLVEALCRFCGACVEVCPTGALRDQHGVEVLIGGQAPCMANCPLGIDVPCYIELIADGNDFEALELIRQRAVLPGVLGYACFHPCEDHCRRSELDDSLSICALKRYISDTFGDKVPPITKAPSTGKRVAVIGGGPAGLAASAELLKCGHSVTVIERDNQLGGMLRQTIPKFRLPDEVIDRDLEYLFVLGLETRLGIEFGSDTDINQLREEGFDVVIVAVGLPEAVRLEVDGEDLDRVEPGLDFLRRAVRGEIKRMTGKVVVIGGGAVAVDAAMTARRFGADKVMMVCLESNDEMPAFKEELEAATAEGIEVLNRWGVDSIGGEAGGVKKVFLKRCMRVFDEQGRFNPQYDTKTTGRMEEADWVIVAIGQRIEDAMKPFIVKEDGLFIAGDAVTGPSSIVAAMADGRRIAGEVDAYLGGSTDSQSSDGAKGEGHIGSDPEFHKRHRIKPDQLPPDQRVETMTVFTSTYSEEQSRTEAARCLRCHLRASLMKAPLPPDPWRKFDEGLLDEVPSSGGVLILADEDKKSVKIAGSADINKALSDLLDDEFDAIYCRWELGPMYTQRESELIQAHLQAFGEIPGGDELDDLF